MTSSSRLQTVAPDIVEVLRRVDAERLRHVARVMAELAVAQTKLSDPRVEPALASLTKELQQVGTAAVRPPIQALTDELDDAAWRVQEQFESGNASERDYLRAFRLARAAATLWFALSTDPMEAAAESAYEASAAAGDLDVVRNAVAMATIEDEA